VPTKYVGTTRYRASNRWSSVYAGSTAPDLAVTVR
jgi:hypothetical protein